MAINNVIGNSGFNSVADCNSAVADNCKGSRVPGQVAVQNTLVDRVGAVPANSVDSEKSQGPAEEAEEAKATAAEEPGPTSCAAENSNEEKQ